jgi:hypothetical protein
MNNDKNDITIGGFSKLLNNGLMVYLKRDTEPVEKNKLLISHYNVQIAFGPRQKQDGSEYNTFLWKKEEGAIWISLGTPMAALAFFEAVKETAINGNNNIIWGRRDNTTPGLLISSFIQYLGKLFMNKQYDDNEIRTSIDRNVSMANQKDRAYTVMTKSNNQHKTIRIVYNELSYGDSGRFNGRTVALIATITKGNSISVSFSIPDAIAFATLGIELCKAGFEHEQKEISNFSFKQLQR